MFRKLPYIVFLLHAYVAWQLLPHLQPYSPAFAATALWLIASVIATPLWPVARNIRRQPLKDSGLLRKDNIWQQPSNWKKREWWRHSRVG